MKQNIQKRLFAQIHIGRVVLPSLMFEGEFLIHRSEATEVVTFLGEKYRVVNTEKNCYIKETEYNQLFN